jgi:prefoldin subunit 5
MNRFSSSPRFYEPHRPLFRATLCLLLGLLVAAFAAPPAPAKPRPPKAITATIKGTVVGTPYAQGRQTVLPVLLSSTSPAKAKPSSPLGILVVTTSKRFKTPSGQLKAARFRVGDVFKAKVKLTAGVRRQSFWQVKPSTLSITKRSTTLSNAELQDLVGQMRTGLASLTASVTGLAGYTVASFNYVAGELAGLHREIASLREDLITLKGQVAALSASMNSAISSLQAQINALSGDVEALKAQMQQVQAQLAALQASLANLQSQLNALTAQVNALSNQNAALTTAVGNLNAALADVQQRLTTVEELLAISSGS